MSAQAAAAQDGPAPDAQRLVQGGRYAFVRDDGYCAVFRSADRGRSFALFAIAVLAIVGFTLRLLLQEPNFRPLAWGIAGLADFSVIYSLHIVRRARARGPLLVDGAERRIFLHQGAELAFDRICALQLERKGALAELVLVHQEGVVRLGRRPAAETELAAAAVARILGMPIERTIESEPRTAEG